MKMVVTLSYKLPSMFFGVRFLMNNREAYADMLNMSPMQMLTSFRDCRGHCSSCFPAFVLLCHVWEICLQGSSSSIRVIILQV